MTHAHAGLRSASCIMSGNRLSLEAATMSSSYVTQKETAEGFVYLGQEEKKE